MSYCKYNQRLGQTKLDITAIISPGVYILRQRGRVVFVGAARFPLARIYAHSSYRRGNPAPKWLPTRPVSFDVVELRPCRVEDLFTALADTCLELGWAQHQETACG